MIEDAKSKPKPELRALTSVRGIAAWFVVLYHIRLSMAFLPDSWIAVMAKGYLAVDFFFLLSGFVIWLTWGKRLRSGGIAAVPGFFQRRIARVWPLHLFMLGIAIALALLLRETGRGIPELFPFDELPLHVLLLQNWGFTHTLTWNNPSWSISTEFAAYLLFPVTTMAIDWRRVPSAAVLAAIAALFVLLHAVMLNDGAHLLGDDITRFGLLRCVIEFSAGNAICALWLRWAERPVGWAIGSVVIGVALLTAWQTGAIGETLAVPPAFGALLLALALTSGMRWNVLERPALHYLGEISYATYLSHFLLFMIFKLAMVDDPTDIPPVLIVLFLAMVLMTSIALYQLVERPAQRAVNRWRWPIRPREAHLS